MINVKKTILSTIKDKINRFRFLSDFDYKSLKKILSLIVLDDLYDWSSYLDNPQAIQEKLKNLRLNYILCQKDFKIEYSPSEEWYTNVNIDHYNGNRVSDFDGFRVIDENIDPDESCVHLSELDNIDSDGYMITDNIKISPDGYLKIFENTIDNEDYIVK